MHFEDKTVLLKDGRQAFLRSPQASDAHEMMDFLRTCASETLFTLRYPEEYEESDEQEAALLERVSQSQTGLMLICMLDGAIAGLGQIQFQSHLMTRHRANVGISIVKKYWNLGIGHAIFGEMTSLAREKGALQLELDYVEGNERARVLYEKLGFVHVGERPDAVRLKDGTMLKEYSMVKKL